MSYNLRKLGRKLDCLDKKIESGVTRNKGSFILKGNAYREMFLWEIEELEKEKERLMKMLPKNVYPRIKIPAIAVIQEDGEHGYMMQKELGSPYQIQLMRQK